MRALVCENWCEFRDLLLTDVDEPAIRPASVRIAVRYAGVGFAHSLVVAGKYQVRPPRPFIPGTELVGTVEEVGNGVDHVKKGDRVLATVDWGAFAETVVAPAVTVYRLPPEADLLNSLHLATSYPTAYVALAWRARLQPGETLLVHGAGGAIGMAAVEIGRMLGATVIACASSEEKRAAALEHGARHALQASGFRERVKELTGGRGADVVFDPVGGEVFSESLRSVSLEGRIIPVGFASGQIPQIPANIVLVKNISVLGVYFGTYIKEGSDNARERYAPKIQAMMSELIRWMCDGSLRPCTGRVFDFSEYAKAMDFVLQRKSIGKVALRIGSS